MHMLIPRSMAESQFPRGSVLLSGTQVVRVTAHSGDTDVVILQTEPLLGSAADEWVREEAKLVLLDARAAAVAENGRDVTRHLRAAAPLLGWLHIRLLGARRFMPATSLAERIALLNSAPTTTLPARIDGIVHFINKETP